MLCPLPESYREAELQCYMEKDSRETKPVAPHLQHRAERSPSQGSSAYPAVDTNWSGWKNVFVEQNVYRCIFNQSRLLKPDDNNPEITVGNVGCVVFHCKDNWLR